MTPAQLLHVILLSAGTIARGQHTPAGNRDTVANPSVTAQAKDVPVVIDPAWRLRNADDVGRQFAAWMGCAQPEGAIVDLVRVRNVRTPCLDDEQPMAYWIVPVRAQEIVLDEPHALKTRPLNYDAWFDAKAGHLVGVFPVPQSNEADIWPPPCGASAAKQMENSGPEVWKSFLAAPPPTTFVAALREVQTMFGGVGEARQVLAFAVNQGTAKDGPFQAVWSIELRGMPQGALPHRARKQRNEHDDINYANHLRHIVQAETGKWVMATNIPQPDAPPGGAPNPANPSSREAGSRVSDRTPDASPRGK